MIEKTRGKKMKLTFVRELAGWTNDARLYKTDGEPNHVIVSGAWAYSGPETYIFPANSAGQVTDWAEMEGSFRGEIDHERAIREAGWTLQAAESIASTTAEEQRREFNDHG